MNTLGSMGDKQRDFRRIGRKALASGRTLVLLEARVEPETTAKRRFKFQRWHLAIPIAIIVILGGVFGGNAFLHAQAIAKQKAEAAAQNAHARAVSAKAEACRQNKMKEKSAAIGTLTYDQLYDNGACNF